GTGIDMRPVDEAARLSAETIAAQQAELRRLESENAQLRREADAWRDGSLQAVDMTIHDRIRERDDALAKLATLIVAASAALDYISENIDADLRGNSFRGNRESDLAQELSEAIRKAKGER